jgi:hypothetical protein
MKGLKDVGQYKRLAANANAAVAPVQGSLLRFICSVAGTLQVTEGVLAGGADIISTMPVAAGTIYPFQLDCPLGAWAVLAGGAAGTFAC